MWRTAIQVKIYIDIYEIAMELKAQFIILIPKNFEQFFFPAPSCFVGHTWFSVFPPLFIIW